MVYNIIIFSDHTYNNSKQRLINRKVLLTTQKSFSNKSYILNEDNSL